MEYYEKAAKWWKEKIRKVVPEHFISYGFPKYVGAVCELRVDSLDKLLASYYTDEPPEELLDSFEKKLSDVIKEHVERFGKMSFYTFDSPEYDLLGKIAKEVGLDSHRIPHNASMQISREKVTVQYGTNRAYITIFPE